MKNIRIFYLKISHFLVVKFSVYLNRHVFVMCLPSASGVYGPAKIEVKIPRQLYCSYMMSLNKTQTLRFALLCVLCFEGYRLVYYRLWVLFFILLFLI